MAYGFNPDRSKADVYTKQEVDQYCDRAYDTVADMQADTTLSEGMICHTLGFHATGGGGAAWYKVAASGDILLANGLYAEYIYSDEEQNKVYIVDDEVISFTDNKFSSYQLENTYSNSITNLINDATYNIVQGCCYVEPTGHMVIAFADVNYLKAKLVECSLDLKTVYNVSSALDIGHANSLTYHSFNGEIWVACGDSGVYAQKIVVLDASDLTVQTTISMSFNPWAIAYDAKNQITYCSNYSKIAILGNDYSIITTVDIDSFTALFPNSLGQGGVCIDGMFYITWSEIPNGKGYLSSYDLETGHVCKFFEIPLTRNMQEVEDAFTTNDKLCIISAHQLESVINNVFSLMPNNSVSMQPTLFTCGNNMFIVDGSDLDNFNSPGRFFCSTGTRAATIANYPSDLIGGNFGFALLVIEIGADHLMQVIISNIGNICMRFSTDTGYTYGNWKKVSANETDNIYERGIFLENGTDLNTLKTPGKYYTSSGTRAQTHVNYPYSIIGIYGGYSLIVSVTGYDHISQMLISNASKVVFRASDDLNNNTWYEWKELTNTA